MKIKFVSLFLFFSTLFSFGQNDKELKKDIIKLIEAFNNNDYTTITNCIYPEVFKKGLDKKLIKLSLSTFFFATKDISNCPSSIDIENEYKIITIDNRNYSVIKYLQVCTKKRIINEKISREEIENYMIKKKEELISKGYNYDYKFDEKDETVLYETTKIDNYIVAISDKSTKNKWKFIFKLYTYELAKVEDLFGEEIKKQLDL